MRSAHTLYPLVLAWLTAFDGRLHRSARAALAHLVTALLVAQSLHAADLMRALDCPTAVPARQRFKRVARSWERPWLACGWLTPRLVRAGLALVAPDPPRWPTGGLTHLVLDTLRCGRWEVVTLGVAWHGRVLPLAWRVLPCPRRGGQLPAAVLAVVRQVAAVWPADRAAHLVADRGLTSAALLRTLVRVGWAWTLRLRASCPLTLDGTPTTVRALLAHARVGRWQAWTAGYGSEAHPIAGQVVIGRGLVVLAAHQRTAGSLGPRARQRAERAERARLVRRRQPHPETDAWMALFTSLGRPRAAVSGYRVRWATEGSYRDVQGGWDGRHGWDLEAVLGTVRTAAHAERLVGLWALTVQLQQWIGVAAVHAAGDVRAIVAEWTTSGRLSVWGHGQLALTEPSGRLATWLRAVLLAGAARIAAAPASPRGTRLSWPTTSQPTALPQAA